MGSVWIAFAAGALMGAVLAVVVYGLLLMARDFDASMRENLLERYLEGHDEKDH